MMLRPFSLIGLLLILYSCSPESESTNTNSSILGLNSRWQSYSPPLELALNDQGIDLDFDGTDDLRRLANGSRSSGGLNYSQTRLYIENENWEIAHIIYADSVFTCQDSVLGTWAGWQRKLYSGHLNLSCERPIHEFYGLDYHTVPMRLNEDGRADTIKTWINAKVGVYLQSTDLSFYVYSHDSHTELDYYKNYSEVHYLLFRKTLASGYRYAWCKVRYDYAEDKLLIDAIGYSNS